MPPKTTLCLLLFAFLYTRSSAQLKADFTSNTQQGCAPLVVQFVDASAGIPTQWFWDLGNGTTSTKQNPGVIYINPGTYTVKLVIKNASGQDSVIKTNYITVYTYPTPALTVTPTNGCAPFNVKFTDKSVAGSGTVSNWIWDFGDGNVSTEQNPQHTYNISDTFDVSLTVVNSFGCRKTIRDTSLIKVGGLIRAGFTYTYNNICKPPSTIKFNDLSISKTPITYQWTFGDGAASTEKDPVHIYTTSGNFTAQLIIINEEGCSDTTSQTISIGGIKADFAFTNGCVNEPIIFTDKSTPKPVSATWDFGDGGKATGYEVQHIYTTAGSYQVTLIANFGTCADTLRKTVQTVEKVQADFTESGKLKSCVYPVTINFTSNSAGATAYKWLFGDNTTSTEKNPTHVFSQPGEYSVTLIAYNTTGCQDSITKTNLVSIGPPSIRSIQNLPFEGCAPQTISMKPVVFSPEDITAYKWDFGDGKTSAEAQPTHTYTNAGVYAVKLIVITASGCSDTLLLPSAVVLGKPPTAAFTADPLQTCAKTPVQFTDKSTGLVTDWLWIFGDGSTSAEQNPENVYTDTGYFDVSLIVGQYGCYDTLTLEKYIYIKSPVAKFASATTCENPYLYKFTDKSIGAKIWHWDFGDGNTSNLQSPTHTYSAKGTYAVSLTVTNAECTDREIDSIRVIEENPAFKYESVSPNFCKYDSIHFYVTQYDPENIRYYKWDFGDGTTTGALLRNNDVYHFYNDAGTYSPLLIITDDNGCQDTLESAVPVNIFGPNAAFSNEAGNCIFSTVNFTDESTSDGKHPITKWIWDYGDGSKADTLTAAPFKHTYADNGLFDVYLKVIDNIGCYDTLINNRAVEITKPVAGFYADTLSCSGYNTRFVDTSSGVSLLYNWYFGDGTVSSDPQPTHVYAKEGSYDVKLVLHDKYGCTDSVLKPKYVLVANPVADFSISDSSFLCPPVMINPTNNSRNYDSLTWYFGDGSVSVEATPVHYYTLADTYPLSLIVKGYGNCYDTLTKTIIVKGPSAKLSYSPLAGCDTLSVSFKAPGKNIIQYVWDFGDGGIQITTDSLVNYTYSKPGKLLPKIVIEDSAGCKVTIFTNDSVTISGVNALYSAGFNVHTCDSLLYEFRDSSIVYFDEIASYKWKFGDGDSSIQANPSHMYYTSRQYNTSLQVTTVNGCTSSYKLPVNIFIDTTNQIFANIPDSACVNAPVSLSAGTYNTSAGSMTWQWNFGNGAAAFSKDTVYSYSAASTYNAFVVGTNAAGCPDTARHFLHIDPLPPVDAGVNSEICREQSIVLNATGADTYTWFADATLSCLDCASPTANPLINNTYYVTGKNNFGCIAKDSVSIEVKQPITVSATAPDTTCTGTLIQLQATGAEVYKWQPESMVANPADSATTSSPTSTTVYTVIGSDDKGCFSDTASLTVSVFPYPTLQIPDSVITINVGSEYKITTIASPDIVFWQWMPLAGLSCSNCAEPIMKPTTSQIYTVNAQNIAGCSVEKHINVTVLCKDQNLFIPNTFSPNGDGMNDYFYPRGKGLFTVKSFRIFSRIGNLVFEKTNFPPNQQTYGWDGRYKGNALQPDVYVFVAEVVCENGTVLSTKGNVTLLR